MPKRKPITERALRGRYKRRREMGLTPRETVHEIIDEIGYLEIDDLFKAVEYLMRELVASDPDPYR